MIVATGELLARLEVFEELGRPVCLGVSRKGTIDKILSKPVDERLIGSVAIACLTSDSATASRALARATCAAGSVWERLRRSNCIRSARVSTRRGGSLRAGHHGAPR